MTLIFRSLLLIGIVVGAFLSISTGRLLESLADENRELKRQAGDLRVDDPNRVYVVALNDDLVREGVDSEIVRLWKFRIYYPPGYNESHYVRAPLIAKDSPRADPSGKSSFTLRGKREPDFDKLSLSISLRGEQWQANRVCQGSSEMTPLGWRMSKEKLDELVVEPVVRPGETISFEKNEPFCVLRVREKEPQRKSDKPDEQPLYRGFYHYIVPDEERDSFEEQVRGEIG